MVLGLSLAGNPYHKSINEKGVLTALKKSARFGKKFKGEGSRKSLKFKKAAFLRNHRVSPKLAKLAIAEGEQYKNTCK